MYATCDFLANKFGCTCLTDQLPNFGENLYTFALCDNARLNVLFKKYMQFYAN